MTDQHEPTEAGAQPSSSESQHSTLGPQYSIDPRVLAAIYGMAPDDEIDLMAYWGIIKKRWKLLASVMLAAAIISAGISLLKPNIYEAKVLMAPVNTRGSDKSGGGLAAAAALGRRLGSLISPLTGVSQGTEQNLAVLKSRTFLWSFIKDNKLMPILFAKAWDAAKKSWKKSDPKKQPNLWSAYRLLKNILSVSTDKDSGLVTVSVDWTNPTLAADWANRLVARLNDYLRRQAIARSEANLKYLNEALGQTSVADVRQTLYDLIAQEQKKAMIANAQKEYAFRILDAAASPDQKSKPHRTKIVLLSTFVAGVLSTIFVFVQESNRKRRLAEAESK